MLNVKDVSEKASLENEEIQNLVRILGLKYGKVYENTDSLRYGRLLTMTDQVGMIDSLYLRIMMVLT